jgi:hypothetical protein
MHVQLPADLPEAAPFEVSFCPVVNHVLTGDKLDATALKEAIFKLKVARILSCDDLLVRLEPTDPLRAEIAAAGPAGGDAARCAAGPMQCQQQHAALPGSSPGT